MPTITVTRQAIGLKFAELWGKQMDAQIMASAGKPIPVLDRQQIEKGLATFKAWAIRQDPYECPE